MKMYLVLSQVEHQTIECHRKNITIVYLFGLSVVSLSYCYKPGRPPLPASLACPGRPPLADLCWPPLASHTSPAALPWQTSPGTPWQTSLTDLPCRPPLAQTSPNTPLADIPCLADLRSASHTSLAGLEKTKNDECLEFFSFFYQFFITFHHFLIVFIHFPLFPWRKKSINN